MAFDAWKGSVWVVITVGHQPDVAGAGCDPRGDERGVEAAAHPIGPIVGAQRVVGLQRQAVLDGDEVQQAAFGLGDQVGPVAGCQQVGGPGVGLTPGRGMPSRAVECDGEMKSIGATGHGRSHFRSRSPPQRCTASGSFLSNQSAAHRPMPSIIGPVAGGLARPRRSSVQCPTPLGRVRRDRRTVMPMANERVPVLMVVHAHPDDESSQTGGTLARYAAAGCRTVLVTCTDGAPGRCRRRRRETRCGRP